mmetsp:Transcript_15455/g.36503  ORF Transcript_15455/g.36503 Transcript_15455/m.36503 type:complete len:344 (+) Transcript_15455:45-1076(+)
MAKNIVLVIGGAGYIGTHCCVSVLEAGFQVVVLDNLSNSSEISLTRVQEITGKEVAFHNVDICNQSALDAVVELYEGRLHSAILLAGVKAVGESVSNPLLYYDNNVCGAVNVFKCLSKHGCKKLVFSSSACVYGAAKEVPVTEESPLSATNPYGRTKLFIEEILRDLCTSDDQWGVVLLRYFNPIGAHPSGRIGEDPDGVPNNLMPYIAQVAVGKRAELTVHGGDYDTPDGTGVRDYLHISDLAEGHVTAIKLLSEKPSGCRVYNLGTGQGYSVLEMVKAMEKACGKEIKYIIGPRRAGDSATMYCDPKKAEEELHWKATRGLDEMCRDLWAWQSANPKGYRE